MSTAPRVATYFHIHLVSDSTGETLNAMARAVCARFTDILPIEHIYALVRSPRQLERALEEIAGAPGVVMHTIVDAALRTALEEGCRRHEIPCIAALDPVVAAMSRYLGAPISSRVGAQHNLDTDYFNRMEALNYAIGRWLGPKAFTIDKWFLKHEHLERTQAFYEKHGGKTIVLARFVPIVRTFAPFVAGVGKMNYSTFLFYNVVGGIAWVLICTLAGYFFGNMPVVKENFELVVVGIVVVSVLPLAWEMWSARRK
jgi:hypothetical protein